MSTPQPKQTARLRGQEQAKWAYDLVLRWTQNADDKKKKEVKSHLRKLPSHLQSSGLAQTLLFYAKQHPEIARELTKKLLEKSDVAEGVKVLAGLTAAQYRAKAREAMTLAGWLKRFAEAMIEDKQ